jgi:hypothetical protein
MPELADNFVEVIVHHTAGDPARDGVVWTYLTQQQIADELAELGTVVSTETVRQLLDDFEFSKRKAQKSVPLGEYEHRNEQFEHIAKLKEEHLADGNPVLCMDTKKKETLGNFLREGKLYATGPLKTFDHDFRSQSDAMVIPHGLYDFQRNVGHITLGLSHDTSEFACDSFRYWWTHHEQFAYPDATEILLLCDAGGSNSYRHHIFKEDLQRTVNQIQIPIRVAHYPPYCSKYNPIDHRLFPHVARACQGIVFRTLDIVKRFIRRTTTSTGLRVTLHVLEKCYEKGRTASTRFMENCPIVFDAFLPELNYLVVPREY